MSTHEGTAVVRPMQGEISKLIIAHCLANRFPWLSGDSDDVYLAVPQIAEFLGWAPKTLENRMSDARRTGWVFDEHPAKPNMFGLESVKQGLAHAAKTEDTGG